MKSKAEAMDQAVLSHIPVASPKSSATTLYLEEHYNLYSSPLVHFGALMEYLTLHLFNI